MLNASGTAKIKSDTTGEIFEVNPGDLDWQGAGGGERSMGPESLYTASVEFTGKDGKPVSCEWTVSEYPVGVLNNADSELGNGTLVSDFVFSIDDEGGNPNED